MERRSRVYSDMRAMAQAVESYYVDYDAYPPHAMVDGEKVLWNSPLLASSFRKPPVLTTPLAYVNRYYTDPFNKSSEGKSIYAYWQAGEYWFLYSPAVDGDFDIDVREFEKRFVDLVSDGDGSSVTIDLEGAMDYLERMSWDTSNGTMSSGDIYRNGGLVDLPYSPAGLEEDQYTTPPIRIMGLQ